MPLPDLDINLLRAFVAVVDSGSFIAAASTVGRTQSAVSQKMTRLESLVGSRIYERSSRSLTLTQTGERLLAAARSMIEANDDLLRSLRTPSAALRLGIAEDFLPGLLSATLARFVQAHTDTRIELTTGLSCDIVASYQAKRLDAAIIRQNAGAGAGRLIWREPVCWMAARSHKPTGAPAQLVMLPKPCFYRTAMIDALGKINRDWIASCTSSSLTGVQAAVAGGLGVTALGRSFLTDEMQELTDSARWPALPAAEIALLSEGGHCSHLVEALMTFLTEKLSLANPTRDAGATSFDRDHDLPTHLAGAQKGMSLARCFQGEAVGIDQRPELAAIHQ